MQKKKQKKAPTSNGNLTKGTPSNKAPGRMLSADSFIDYYLAHGQTEPPSIPVVKLFSLTTDENNSIANDSKSLHTKLSAIFWGLYSHIMWFVEEDGVTLASQK